MAIRHFGAAALLALSLLASGIAATTASAHGSEGRRFERDGYRYDRAAGMTVMGAITALTAKDTVTIAMAGMTGMGATTALAKR